MVKKCSLYSIQVLPLATLLGVAIVICDHAPSLATTSVANTTRMPSEEKQQILQLLRLREFQQLETHYMRLQEQYETDHSLNDWQLLIQYQPFYDVDPANEVLLTEWVTQFPKSYPARLARGIYYRKVGQAERGDEWASKTPRKNFEQLDKYLNLATDDLLASRSLTPKPIVSIVHLMNVTMHRDGALGNRYWLDEANRIDPSNYGARRRYMFTLTPRWGGSYEEMYAYLQECRSQQISAEHIRTFESFIHSDMANMERHNHRAMEAYTHYRHALMLLKGIENEETADALRGLIYSAKAANALDSVADDLDHYLHLWPQDSKILSYRGWLRENRGRPVEAMVDFKEAATQGDVWSQFKVGKNLLYDKSSTTEEKRREGLAWLRRSAQQGYGPAQQLLRHIGEGKLTE